MSAKNGTSTLATRSVRIQMAVIRWVPDSQKNRKQTKKTKKKQTNPRRNENPKPQSMGNFTITLIYQQCTCVAGYELTGRTHCQAKKSLNKMKLFFTHTNMIFSMGMDGKDKVFQRKNEKKNKYSFPRPQVSIANATAASGLDFHFKRHLLFFTDTDKRKVTWPLV